VGTPVHAQSWDAAQGEPQEDPIAAHTLTQVYRREHRRYIIVGDVHGCREELLHLLEKCEYSKEQVCVCACYHMHFALHLCINTYMNICVCVCRAINWCSSATWWGKARTVRQ
jgi:hypothetical protein